MIKEYKNKYSYDLPIQIGTEIFITTCLGCLYDIDEVDKFSGWKVTQIQIKENGINFEIKKGDSMEGWIPLKYLGKLYFLTKEDAIEALKDMHKMNKDDTLEDFYNELYDR